MGFCDQLSERLSPLRRSQVQAHALLVAVQAGEVAVGHLPGDLAAGRLDLDDLGAEIGEHHRGVGTGQHDADLEDPDSGQRARAVHCGPLRRLIHGRR